jgi:hypothetical protein
VRPGREQEAATTFADIDRHDRRLGAEPELWVVRYGSGAFGRHVREMGFDSFEELRAFDEISATAQAPRTPIDLAVQAGVLHRISMVLTTSVNLE